MRDTMPVEPAAVNTSLIVSLAATVLLLKWRDSRTVQAIFLLWMMTGLLYTLGQA